MKKQVLRKNCGRYRIHTRTLPPSYPSPGLFMYKIISYFTPLFYYDNKDYNNRNYYPPLFDFTCCTSICQLLSMFTCILTGIFHCGLFVWLFSIILMSAWLFFKLDVNKFKSLCVSMSPKSMLSILALISFCHVSTISLAFWIIVL